MCVRACDKRIQQTDKVKVKIMVSCLQLNSVQSKAQRWADVGPKHIVAGRVAGQGVAIGVGPGGLPARLQYAGRAGISSLRESL